MGHNELVCGACAGRVVEGRCPVCRSLRSELRWYQLPDWQSLLLPVLGAIAALACLLTYYVKMA